MDGFYEKAREDEFRIMLRRNDDFTFRAHFHSNMEILIVKQGGYRVHCNDKTLDVKEGCIAVFDSYDVHWYESRLDDLEADNCVLIVPCRLSTSFNALRKDQAIDPPLLQDEKLCERLLFLIDEYVQNDSQAISDRAVELILALIFERLTFSPQEKRTEVGLMRKILIFVQEHYREPLSLSLLAKTLGYTEEHVSRVFRRYANESLSTYVNRLRLAYVTTLRKNGDKRKTIELLYEAGFQSPQTYYRWLAAQNRMEPV